MERPIALLAVTGIALAAGCGGGGGGTAFGPCAAAPSPVPRPAGLPRDFPTPDAVTYTADRAAGPSTILEGYWDGDLEEAFEGYKDAFETAGYDITDEEREAADAEVNFDGGGSNGQVRLGQECEDRTEVRITIRPA